MISGLCKSVDEFALAQQQISYSRELARKTSII